MLNKRCQQRTQNPSKSFAFDAKGRQYIYTKGKVIQPLFISIYIHSDLSLQVKQMVNPVYLQ